MTTLVNDVHSRLNPTGVADVARPRSLDELRGAVRRAAKLRLPLVACGGRHAMGGQQFCRGGVLLETSALTAVLSLDTDRGLVEAEAGVQWPALIQALAGSQWSIRQKQAGADDFSLGGAVSANIHGRGLALAPFVADVERLVLVGPDGRAHTCSRERRPDLFRLVCGGYGLFGLVYAVTLRLAPRCKLERVVELVQRDELMSRIDERIDSGCLYGDLRLDIDPRSKGYLGRGVLSCARPVSDEAPLSVAAGLGAGQSEALRRLAHSEPARAFELYALHALGTSGRVEFSDRHQLDVHAHGRHWAGSSEMTTELYVPRSVLADFLGDAAQELRARDAVVIDASVRLVERDDETLLAWAREPWACASFDLHVEHDAVSVGRAADTFRALIDVALAYEGSYHLTYHRWARRDQVEAAHPRIHRFLREKQSLDPGGVFASEWYRHLLRLLDVREAA